MFVSAGIDLKFHFFSEHGVENHSLFVPPSQRARVRCVSWCRDNSFIAFVQDNSKPQILSIDKVRIIHTLEIDGATCCIFKRHTKRNLAVGTVTGDVLLYDTKARCVSKTFHRTIEDVISGLDYSLDDQYLCALCADSLLVYNGQTQMHRLNHRTRPTCVRCHPIRVQETLIGGVGGQICCWDVLKGVELYNFQQLLPGPITKLIISGSGSGNLLLATSGIRLKIANIDRHTGCCTFGIDIKDEIPITAMDLSSNDKVIAIGLADGSVKLYDFETQSFLYGAKFHDTAVCDVAFAHLFQCAPPPSNNRQSVVEDGETVRSIDANESVVLIASKTPSFPTPQPLYTVEDPATLLRLKTRLMRTIKLEMDQIEQNFSEQCGKFQRILDNEFELVDCVIRDTWKSFSSNYGLKHFY